MNAMLSIGDRVPAGLYHVHSRFGRVVNFCDDGCMVSLVDKTIDPGPCRLVTRAKSMLDAESLRVEKHEVFLDDTKISLDAALTYDSHINWTSTLVPTLESNVELLGEVLAEEASARSLAFLLDSSRLVSFHRGFETSVAEHVHLAVTRMLPRIPKVQTGLVLDDLVPLIEGVGMLSGCGFGLTPSGDDYVCGMLLALHVLEKVWQMDLRNLRDLVYLAATTDNDLSMQFLSLARDGRVFAGMKHLLTSLAGDGRGVRGWTMHLLDVGESSGADMAVGLLLTLRCALGIDEREGVLK